MGPYAGLDLARKILDQTVARCDQDHVSIALLSAPQEIGDRTSFLLGHTNVNPAYAIYKMIQKLKEIRVSVVGIPGNTAHAPQIFDVILEELKRVNSEIAFALKNQNITSIPIIDPMVRALIKEVDPTKLKPLKVSIL